MFDLQQGKCFLPVLATSKSHGVLRAGTRLRKAFPAGTTVAIGESHCISCTGNGHHVNARSGDRPPRQTFLRKVATTAIHEDICLDGVFDLIEHRTIQCSKFGEQPSFSPRASSQRVARSSWRRHEDKAPVCRNKRQHWRASDCRRRDPLL